MKTSFWAFQIAFSCKNIGAKSDTLVLPVQRKICTVELLERICGTARTAIDDVPSYEATRGT